MPFWKRYVYNRQWPWGILLYYWCNSEAMEGDITLSPVAQWIHVCTSTPPQYSSQWEEWYTQWIRIPTIGEIQCAFSIILCIAYFFSQWRRHHISFIYGSWKDYTYGFRNMIGSSCRECQLQCIVTTRIVRCTLEVRMECSDGHRSILGLHHQLWEMATVMWFTNPICLYTVTQRK